MNCYNCIRKYYSVSSLLICALLAPYTFGESQPTIQDVTANRIPAIASSNAFRASTIIDDWFGLPIQGTYAFVKVNYPDDLLHLRTFYWFGLHDGMSKDKIWPEPWHTWQYPLMSQWHFGKLKKQQTDEYYFLQIPYYSDLENDAGDWIYSVNIEYPGTCHQVYYHNWCEEEYVSKRIFPISITQNGFQRTIDYNECKEFGRNIVPKDIESYFIKSDLDIYKDFIDYMTIIKNCTGLDCLIPFFESFQKIYLDMGLSSASDVMLDITKYNPQTQIRTVQIKWRTKICVDRALVILSLPSEVEIIPGHGAIHQWEKDGRDYLLWIVNGVDKVIEPPYWEWEWNNFSEVNIRAPEGGDYPINAQVEIQIGPFQGKPDDSYSNVKEIPFIYNYNKWQTSPQEAYWYSIDADVCTETLSTKPNIIYQVLLGLRDYIANATTEPQPIEIPLDDGIQPVTSTKATVSADADDISAAGPSYYPDIRWDHYGHSEVKVDIDPSTHIATITVPADWTSKEEITFVFTDPNGNKGYQRLKVIGARSGYVGTGTSALSLGSVAPTSGTKDDMYSFSVEYRNQNNIYPKRALVIINNIPHNMKMRSGSPPVKDGAIFEYKGKLSTTDNFFYFEFGDGIARFRHPETEVIPGPTIAELHDIAIRNFSIYPETPEANDLVEVRAQIENLGTQLEPNIPVVFKVNNVAQDSHLINVSVEETSPVIVFTYQIPISDYTENYELKIEAGPVGGETSIDSVNLTIVPKPGAISGWVFDQWNNPVEGATVKVIESTVGDYGSTTSDSDGYYYLDGLKPTPEPEDYYTLEAYKEGLGGQTKTGVVVHSMQTTAGKNFNIMEVQWTQITSGDYYEEDTFWSPSGDKLVFTRIVDKGTPSWYYAIAVMNQDGSGLKYMTGPGKPASEGRRPAWSPDASRILFEKGGNTWLMNADGSGSDAHIIIPSGARGTWSPDSRKIAFSNYNSPAHGQIYIYNLDTSTLTQVTPSGEYSDLAWSPDGKSIAFSDNFGRLGIANIGTGETSLIGMNGDHPSWLPDSTGFVFSSAQHDIWLYRIDTKEFIQITFAPEWEVDPTIPLNDPTKIAFTSDKGIASIGTFAVFKMTFSVPALYFTEISTDPSIFTPNGDGINDEFNLSYKVNKDAYVTLKIYDSQGTYVRTLLDNTLQTAGQHLSQWDGKNQEGNRENDEVYFYRLDMHDASGVAIPAHGRVGMLKNIRELASGAEYPRWSPSGDKIVYLKEEYDPKFGDQVNHIYICEANDFTNKQLVPTPFKVRPPRPDWSRDGSQIVFPSNSTGNQSQIARINIDGTGYTEITTYTLGSLIHGDYPAWSPTEDKIVFSGVWNEPTNNFWYITKINSDGSGLTKVGGYKGISPAAPQAPVWSPDGSKIAYAADRNEDRNFEIYLMNQEGSGEQKITNNPYMDVYPEFTSDGTRLLFGSNRHVGREGSLELWTQPLDGSDKPRCLSKGFGYGVPSLLGDKILVQNSVIELFLSLTKGAIEGKIFDHETLEPIADANVYVYQGGFLVGTTVTNEQGGYQFYNLELGQYVLNAEAEGYIKSYDITVETHPWVVSRDNDIELEHAPSATISEISDGQKIGSVIAINTKREGGNVAYVKYQYKKEGGDWQDIETMVYPYPAVFDTKEPNLSSGNYQIRALAQDTLGNGDPSPSIINVEIDHTSPVAKITSPISGTKFTGTINIRAYCSDPDTDSVLFQYRKRGDVLWINIGSVDVETPWERTWKTDHLIEGEYELRAIAIDKLGNTDENPEVITVKVKSNTSDFDNDHDVDFGDLSGLTGSWLGDNPLIDVSPPGGDGIINLLDFAEFAEHWLEGATP